MRPNILIVEDNADLARILEELLSCDFDVTTARRGEDAVTIARTARPDAVVLDLNLPGIDGVETGLWIKREAEPAHIPILVLTASATSEEAETILSSGCCDAFLAKPAPLPMIRELLDSLLSAVRR
jgi:CheY-like chemotaxis protein